MSLSLFPAGKRGRERAGDWLLGRPTLSARQSSIEGRPYASTDWLCERCGRASFQTVLGLVDLYIQPAGAVDIEASSHIHTIVHTRRYFLVVAGRTRTVRHHITRQMLEGHILQQLARAGSKGMGSS